MASIRRNRSGNWECRVRRRGFPVQTATFDTRAQARDWGNNIEDEISRGRFVDRHEAETTTVGDALKRYLKEVTPRKRSADREQRNAKVILASPLAAMSLAAVRSKHVSDFVQSQEDRGVAANTIRIYLALISHLFTVARREWGIESLANPVEFARKPRLPVGRTRRLVDDEETQLLGAASKDLYDAIVIAVETALRRGELARLTWGSVDLVAGTAVIHETKVGEPRTIPLSPRAVAIFNQRRLADLLTGQRHERIFPWRDEGSISHAFADLCNDLKIEGLCWHDLRHEATSRLFERGLGLQEVASVTGHKTWAMLKRYTHPKAADIAKKLTRV